MKNLFRLALDELLKLLQLEGKLLAGDLKSSNSAFSKKTKSEIFLKNSLDSSLSCYPLVVGKTYFKQGFFNVGVDYERYVTNEDEGVTIYVGPQKQSISGRVSRKYNSNATPRVFGGVILRDWFRENFEVLDVVNVEFLSPTQVWLRKPQFTSRPKVRTAGKRFSQKNIGELAIHQNRWLILGKKLTGFLKKYQKQ